MALARSPYAHAKILDIDTSEAKAMAGVVAVLTGADINPNLSGTVPSGMPIGNPPYSEGKVPTRHVLSTDKVRFMGEPVAVVVAKDPYTAVDALETIFVDYDPLGVVTSTEAALADGAPLIHDGDSNLAFRWGPIGPDVSETFANAAHTIELRIENQRVIANAMEPRAALASYDGSTDSFTIWSTTQSPHGARDTLAGILGTEPDKVRVIAPEVGGGFGIKAPVYTEEIIAAYLTRHLGQPVKWVATRSEDYVSTYHGRGQTDIIRLAADADGRILAADLQIIYDAGAYFSAIAPLIPTLTVLMMVGVYAIPTVRAEITAAFTNRHPADPYRGAGRPEAAFMIERAVDALAQEMGLDAAEIRRRNYIAPDAFPYTTPTPLGGRVSETTNFEVGKTTRHTVSPQGQLARLSVAVILDDERVSATGGTNEVTTRSWEAEGIQRIHGLVAAAVGFDAARGDQLIVENIAFDAPEAAVEAPPPGTGEQLMEGLKRYGPGALRMGAILAVALVALFGILRPLSKRALSAAGAAGALKAPAGGTARLPTVGEMEGQMAGGQTATVPTSRLPALSQRVAKLASDEPEQLAGIVRGWIAEGDR
jgi:hypothetical protein